MAVKSNAHTLREFTESINEQVAALHAACRDLLARQDQSEKLAPREIRIEIRSSLDDPESRTPVLATMERSIECWNHSYVCGESAEGYIYCSQEVCMIVGPITVES